MTPSADFLSPGHARFLTVRLIHLLQSEHLNITTYPHLEFEQQLHNQIRHSVSMGLVRSQ